MKKNILFIVFIIVGIGVFIYLYNKPKSYSLNYQVGEYLVTEKYNKEKNSYHFLFKKEGFLFETILIKKYSSNRKLINKIKTFFDSKNSCITNNLTEPLCYSGQEYISYNLTTTKIKDQINYYNTKKDYLIDDFKQTSIYNYLDYSYVIRNYKGFDFIAQGSQKMVDIFTNDVYFIDIIAQINNFVIVADYNQQYFFNKFYIIDIVEQTVLEWQLNQKISFDSYILGVNDKSIFLVDRKNETEYEIVPHKQKMRVVGTANKKGKIFKNNIWQEISMVKLINKDYNFTDLQLYNYNLDNNQLYIKYPISNSKQIISNLKINKIVAQKNRTIFYLVDNQLYAYNNLFYEKKLLKNTEWEFNNKNVVYVY